MPASCPLHKESDGQQPGTLPRIPLPRPQLPQNRDPSWHKWTEVPAAGRCGEGGGKMGEALLIWVVLGFPTSVRGREGVTLENKHRTIPPCQLSTGMPAHRPRPASGSCG